MDKKKVVRIFENWCEAMDDDCPVICLHALDLLNEQKDTINELQNAYGYLQKQFFEAQDKLLKEPEWHMLTEDDDGIIHGLPGDDGKDIWIDDYVDGVDDGVWLDSGRDIREIKAWMYMPKLPILN